MIEFLLIYLIVGALLFFGLEMYSYYDPTFLTEITDGQGHLIGKILLSSLLWPILVVSTIIYLIKNNKDFT